MRKVLFFIESLSGGGAEKVLSDIVANVDSKEFDVTVCTVTDQDVYQDKVMQSCKYFSFLKKYNIIENVKILGRKNIWKRKRKK